MQKIFKLKKFYAGLVFFAGVIFLMLINFNRSYKSGTNIMVLFKSEKAVRNSDQTLGNLQLIVQSLSFYERLAKNNAGAKNEAIAELPDYKKKKYWNERVKIERIGQSSVLKITAFDPNFRVVETLNRETTNGLISATGFYYDIKNDIDMRIIDSSITENSFSGSYAYLSLVSLFLGLILSFIFNYFLILFEKNQSEEKIKINFSWPREEAQKKIAEKIQGDAKKQHVMEIRKNEAREFISLSGKKASAPENLPIAKETLFFEKENKEKEIEISEKTSLIHEATPEQVKERLNKLLAGKL